MSNNKSCKIRTQRDMDLLKSLKPSDNGKKKDTLAINDAYKTNGRDVRKTAAELGVVPENSGSRPNFSIAPKSSRNSYYEEMQKLHELRRHSSDKKSVEKKINEKAKNWNKHRNPRNRYDLHYMTVEGAEKYVLDEIATHRRKREFQKLEFVTGVGKNSSNNVSSIQDALLETLKKMDQCHVYIETANRGMIVVDLFYN